MVNRAENLSELPHRCVCNNEGGGDALAALLAKTRLFEGAPADVLGRVLAHALPRSLVPGEILLSPEDDNDCVYVLLSGCLSLHFDSRDSPVIRELPAGVSIGEMSLIDETRPSAYVIAQEECLVLPIHRDLFFHLLDNASIVSRNMLRLLIQWLRANTLHTIQDRQRIAELTSSAMIDCLTGLYNRRWLEMNFARLLSQQARDDSTLCLLVIDIDHFKEYNDTHGHRGGDFALIALGETLRCSLRPTDFATRYGGDEVVVLLQRTSWHEGLKIAERIRQAMSERTAVDAGGASLPGITLSIGVAVSSAGTTPQSLMKDADSNLYRAKANGRNCVCGGQQN